MTTPRNMNTYLQLAAAAKADRELRRETLEQAAEQLRAERAADAAERAAAGTGGQVAAAGPEAASDS